MKNKKNQSILYFILSIFLFSCTIVKNDEIYGDWRVAHIFVQGEEILKNDFKKTGWFPKYNKTKAFFIDREFEVINFYFHRHDAEPMRANFRIKENDSTFFEIYNSNDERFNGLYKRTIKTDTVWDEDIKVAYYFLTLESENTKIMAVKNKALNWGTSK